VYNLGEASRVTGRNRATIYRDIKNGRLSANRTEKGGWEIDPAELNRVYPHPKRSVSGNGSDNASNNESSTAETAAVSRENELLHETIRDLRQRLDASEAERRETQAKLTALLTDQRPAAPPSPWWRRLLGR
jgi:hypothetical protein